MALTTINSDGVKDDSIVNADIKSDAAIAGTKVAPNFGSQNIATTGTLGSSDITLTKPGSAANAKLEIAQSGGGGGTSEILFSDAVSGRGRIFYDHGSNPEVLNLEAAGTIGLSVTTSGNVGINTASPAGKLEIYNAGQTNNRVAITVDEAENSSSRIDFKAGTGSFSSSNIQAAVAGLITNASGALTGDLVFHTNSGDSLSEKARITSSGTLQCNNIKILTVNAFESSANILEGQGTNGVRLRSALSGATVPSFSNKDDPNTGIFLPGSDVIGFTTGGTEKARITAGGDVEIADGNLVVANGHGIDFSASEGGTGTSSEASVLDDYETGIFTPSITFGNNNNNIGFSAAKGSYTKIGRRVFIDVVFNFSAKGDSTGVARLIDLPFTSLDQTVVRTHGFCSYYGNMFSLTGRPTLNHAGNSNKAVFYDDAASTQTTLNEANFANNSLLRLKVEYVCA